MKKPQPTQSFVDELKRKFFVPDTDYIISYIADQIMKGMAEELRPGVFTVWIYGIPANVHKQGNALMKLRYVA